MPELPRTAVVVVHGIGEPHPLDTLRGFVGDGKGLGVLPTDTPVPLRVVINPDGFSQRTYLRRISVDMRNRQGAHAAGTLAEDSEIRTKAWARTVQFYEYYWAYQIRDTTWNQLTAWLRHLFFYRQVPPIDSLNKVLAGTTLARNKCLGIGGIILLLLMVLAITGKVLTYAPSAPPWAYMGLAALAAIALAVYIWILNRVGLIWLLRGVLALTFASAVSAAILWGDWAATKYWRFSAVLALVLVIARTARAIWHRNHSQQPLNSKDPITPFRSHKEFTTRMVAFPVLAVAAVTYFAWAAWDVFAAPAKILLTTVPTLLAIVLAVLGGKLLGGIGDAARYLSSGPDSTVPREAIRTGLVDLLRSLHDAVEVRTGRPMFDRVIVVGHSLGSVIAYDALHTYFTEVTPRIPLPVKESGGPRNDELKKLEDAAGELNNVNQELAEFGYSLWSSDGRDDPTEEAEKKQVAEKIESLRNADMKLIEAEANRRLGPEDERTLEERVETALREFQKQVRLQQKWNACQRQAQRLLRELQEPLSENPRNNKDEVVGGRWLVSDFITVGSPLAHASALLASPGQDLQAHRDRRLMPSNPPNLQVVNESEHGPSLRYNFEGRAVDKTTRLHHAAVFGPTTWSNFYFVHDLVGGPIAPVFGRGIADICVNIPTRLPTWPINRFHARIFDFISGYPHSSYWPRLDRRRQVGDQCLRDAMTRLVLTPESIVIIKGTRDALAEVRTELSQKQIVVNQEERESGCTYCEIRLLASETSNDEPEYSAWMWAGSRAHVLISDVRILADGLRERDGTLIVMVNLNDADKRNILNRRTSNDEGPEIESTEGERLG